MHNNLMNSINLIIYKKCIEKFNKTKYMTNKMKMYENYKARIFNEYYMNRYLSKSKLRLNATNHGKGLFLSPIC